LKERLCSISHIGTALAKLKEQYKNVDFTYVNKEIWWNFETDDSKQEEVIKEEHGAVMGRAVLVFLWVIFRKEKSFALVSHSKIYKEIVKDSVGTVGNARPHKLDNGLIITLITDYLTANRILVW